MKKLSFWAVLLPVLFCACSSFDEEKITPIIPTTPDLQAGFADETRTYIENGKYLRWHEDDRLTAFYGNTLNRQYKFNGKTGANSGTFSLVPSGELGTGNVFDRIYAVYPYNETATITEDGKISLTLPAVQSYAENSFGKDANTMIAVTENLEDTFLSFKNACGYLKLELYAPDGGVVKSIEIKGNNNEKIAGAATATIAFGEAPVVTMADDATTSITLDCGDGISLGTTDETAIEFWVTIPETTFTDGITIKATDSFGATFTKSTDKEVKIERNTIQPMVALKFDGIKPQPNNEIWYTSSDGTVVKPYNADAFGANIVSNVYENGKGIITFDNEILTVGKKAFYCDISYGYHSTLQTIILPNSVNSLGVSAFEGCESLISIALPDAVTKIPSYAFAKTAFKDFTFNDTVTEIGAYAFNSCNKLTSVIIPTNVIEIGNSAFYDCLYLQNVYCKATTPPILDGKYTFYQSGGTQRLKKIYVPKDHVGLYKRVVYWVDYASIIVGYDF